MPKFEIDIDDKGEFVGDVPPALAAIHDRLRAAAHGEGFSKGKKDATEEGSKQIEARIAEERRKIESAMVLDRAKWDDVAQQNSVLKGQLETTAIEARKQLTAREEAHATEITRRMRDLELREGQIAKLTRTALRGLAAQAGARDESLSELEIILMHRIGYREDMEPYVKTEDGTGEQKTTAGNPVSLDAFVRTYLDNHPHHRKAAAGRGGARPGASLSGGGNEPTPESRDVIAHITSTGDRSASTVDKLFKSTRKKAS